MTSDTGEVVNTFGDRLRAAALASGIATPAQLAERCGVSRQNARKWMLMSEASLSGISLLKLSDCLDVRLRWLISGKLPVRWPPGSDDVIELLDRMNAEQVKRWLAAGRRMFRPPRGSGGGRRGS